MTGGGPSRRSHTKSRTGCKTCKRRHIRCDELYAQCRNCTKHQVRCDYMDAAEAEHSSQRSSVDERIVTVPSSADEGIDLWKQTGVFPFPELQIYPTPQPFDMTKDELRLIYHLCSICNELLSYDVSNLTIWTEKIPKFLGLATSFPFVMHAVLSFSANHLAWSQSSKDLRNLQVHYGGVALRGLQEAIGNFSPANADAILAASLLMGWQSTDWLSYSSITSGLHSVLNAMPAPNRAYFLADLCSRETMDTAVYHPSSLTAASTEKRAHILESFINALERLQVSLLGHDLEQHWVNQFLTYIHRLLSIPPAQSPEEQFQHAYMLRKWIYWVPISLLCRPGSKGSGILVLAHLYAAAIALQPIFPDLTMTFSMSFATFPTSFTLPPLEAILRMTDMVQTQQGLGAMANETAFLMSFPRHIVSEYREQQHRSTTPFMSDQCVVTSPTGLVRTYLANPAPHNSTANFDIQYPHTGYGQVRDHWGVPSPGFPPVHHGSLDSSGSAEELHSIGHVGAVTDYTSQQHPSVSQSRSFGWSRA